MSDRSRLVKAGSDDALHNLDQSERIDSKSKPSWTRGSEGAFNTLSGNLKIELWESELKEWIWRLSSPNCSMYTEKQLRRFRRKAVACLEKIRAERQWQASKTPREVTEPIRNIQIAESSKSKPRKAISKLPKTKGFGLRTKEKPYKGPGAPKGPAPEKKPTFVTARNSPSDPPPQKGGSGDDWYEGRTGNFRTRLVWPLRQKK